MQDGLQEVSLEERTTKEEEVGIYKNSTYSKRKVGKGLSTKTSRGPVARLCEKRGQPEGEKKRTLFGKLTQIAKYALDAKNQSFQAGEKWRRLGLRFEGPGQRVSRE